MKVLCTSDVFTAGEREFNQGDIYTAKVTHKPTPFNTLQKVLVGVTNQRKERIIKTYHPTEQDNFFGYHFKEISNQEEQERKNLYFISLLNSLPILQSNGVKQILVANNEESRSILEKVIPDITKYMSLHADEETINISVAGLEHLKANLHTGTEFLVLVSFDKVYSLFKSGTSSEWLVLLNEQNQETLRFKRLQKGFLELIENGTNTIIPCSELNLPFHVIEEGKWAMVLESPTKKELLRTS